MFLGATFPINICKKEKKKVSAFDEEEKEEEVPSNKNYIKKREGKKK